MSWLSLATLPSSSTMGKVGEERQDAGREFSSMV
jgi:hypothetical protein